MVQGTAKLERGNSSVSLPQDLLYEGLTILSDTYMLDRVYLSPWDNGIYVWTQIY